MTRADFEWNGTFWVSQIAIPEWGSDDCVQLVQLYDTPLAEPSEPSMGIVERFLEHKTTQATAALSALTEVLPATIESYIKSKDPVFVEEDLPEVEDEAELLKFVSLSSIYLHDIEADGLPYVGYEAHFPWARMSRIGIVMHGDRCVKAGGTDIAIMQWISKEDAGIEY